MYTVNEYADTLLAQRISMVSGVSRVQVFGAQKYAVRVQVDPDKLAARGIGIDEVQRAVSSSNTNLPTGRLDGDKQAFTIESSGSLGNAAAYRPIIVAWRNGTAVRLEELGNIIDSVDNDKVVAWYDNKRAVILAVQRQPGTNTVEVVDSVKSLLPQLRKEIPPAISLSIAFDASQSIRGSIHDVEFTLLLTIAVVVLVIFLFLRNLSATLIPGCAVPFSIVGTFAVMYLLGYSLNNLSLMALTLSVGFVVDDAIVMLENIVRHMEMGEIPFRGGGERVARDRVHDSLDDVLAGRGVHSGAVHERHRGAAVARILGHHRGGNPDLGFRLAHAHADAGQPLPEARSPRQTRLGVSRAGGRLQHDAALV